MRFRAPKAPTVSTILVTLVERYEDHRWPIAEPDHWDPVDVITYAIRELGHSQSELADVLNSRPRASEILNRERPLTLDMIRAISRELELNPAPALLIKRYPVHEVA